MRFSRCVREGVRRFLDTDINIVLAAKRKRGN